MTPKEKAKDLIDKFSIDLKPFSTMGEWNRDLAKQCALIAVDEMLDFRNNLYINEGSLAHSYLLDIKKELENL